MENTVASSPVNRVAFRFVFLYLLLYVAYMMEGSSEDFAAVEWLAWPYLKVWHMLVPWVAIHLFHVSGEPATYFVTGSGDTTLAYVSTFCCVVLAVAGAAVWTALDRHNDYRRLDGWLRVVVRYALAVTMLIYGSYKVFPLQFRFPGFGRWLEPFGYFSPMGVLWSFMGTSPAYVILSGAAEFAAGLLLMFRRTATLGALISFAVLFNVAALNYCYDVPVKLFSTHLVLMAVFLLAPEMPRLAEVVCDGQPAPRLRRWASVARWTFIGYVVVARVAASWSNWQEVRHAERPPLYGIYNVEKFTRNGLDVPLVITDATLWRKVAIQFPAGLSVQMMDDSRKQFATSYDAPNNTVTVTVGSQKQVWRYARPDEGHVELDGMLGSDAITVRLRTEDMSRFLLVSRGFHWIQEYPFNR